MKRGDGILAGMLTVLLLCTVFTVYHNYSLKRDLRPALPKIDPEVLAEQLERGNLSLKEAEFYRALGKESEGNSPARETPADPEPSPGPTKTPGT